MLTEDERMKLAGTLDGSSAFEGFKGHCPCRKHLCKIKQTSGRTRSENQTPWGIEQWHLLSQVGRIEGW